MPVFSIFKVSSFFLALFIVASINPYYLWGYEQVSFSVFFSLAMFFIIFVYKGLSKDRLIFVFLFFIIVFFYKILTEASFYGALAFSISLSLIFSINDNLLIKTFENIKLILTILLFPAIILWLLHHSITKELFYLGGISPDLIPNQEKVKAGAGYALYPFTVVLDYMLNDQVYRMSGPFDEPGVVGTITALLLAADKFNYRSKLNIVLFVSGLLSFSLAFYVISFVYFLLMSFRNIKVFYSLVALLIVLVSFSSMNETVKRYTFDRVLPSSEGVSGDNRAGTSLNQNFDKWLSSSGYDFMFGVGYEEDGSSSIKILPVKSGFAGVILFLIIFLIAIIAFRNSIALNWYLLVFIGIYFLSSYQRPDVVAPAYFIIFIVGIINSDLNNRSRVIL